MLKRRALTTGIFRPPKTYIQKMRTLFSLSLIAYWPLDDVSGVIAREVISGLNGTYRNTAGTLNGVTLGQAGIGGTRDGTSVAFDGSNGYCNIYSAGLAAVFNGAEGSMMLWAKAGNIFGDGLSRMPMRVRADVNNMVYIEKQANNIYSAIYRGSGTFASFDMANTSAWKHIAITWSTTANKIHAYQNGVEIGVGQAYTTWVGSLASTVCLIGAGATTPSSLWLGNVAHAMVLNRAVTGPEVLKAYQANP